MSYEERCKHVARMWSFYFGKFNTIISCKRLDDFEEECKIFKVDSLDVIKYV